MNRNLVMPYPQLKIKKGKEKSLHRFHPWIFSGAVESIQELNEDCIAEVLDYQGLIIGYGFVELKSQIICRVFEFCKQPFLIDELYWDSKLESSLIFKHTLFNLSETNCFRLVHAEGDYFPGLIVDVYDNVAVVQFRTKGAWKLQNIIVKKLNLMGFEFVFSKSPAYSDWQQGWLGATGPDHVIVKENSILFSVDILKGQKTGFFLDQRENRKLLATYSSGKKVLNCFSYTGGFSMYAINGNASSVDSVDISKDATENARNNAELNNYSENHHPIAADCFEYLRKADKDYDIIILDPPAFCKDIRSVPQASRGYKDINLSAMKIIKPKSLLFTFSCSQHISKDLFYLVFSTLYSYSLDISLVLYIFL